MIYIQDHYLMQKKHRAERKLQRENKEKKEKRKEKILINHMAIIILPLKKLNK